MDKVLGELKNSIAFPYLDDIIIPSRRGHDEVTSGVGSVSQASPNLKIGEMFVFFRINQIPRSRN